MIGILKSGICNINYKTCNYRVIILFSNDFLMYKNSTSEPLVLLYPKSENKYSKYNKFEIPKP